MSKKLFPLKTFQQDAILKRLSELSEEVNSSVKTYECQDYDDVPGDIKLGDVITNGENSLQVFILDKDVGEYMYAVGFPHSDNDNKMCIYCYVYDSENDKWAYDDAYYYGMVPECSVEDEGKVPIVNASGNYELGTISVGTNLHEHKFKTINDTNESFVIDFSASPIEISNTSTSVSNHYAIIITTRATKYTSWNDIADDVENIEAVYIYSTGTGGNGNLKPATLVTSNNYIDGPVSYGSDSSHHTLYLSKERLSGSIFTNYTIDGQSV